MVNEYEDLMLPPSPQFRDGYKPVPAPRTNETIKKHVPNQGKIVKQMANEYEDLTLPPPPQFKDEYKPVPAPTIKNQAPKIEKLDQALKGHTASYTIEIQDSLGPLNHFTKIKEVVESHLKALLKTMKGFKFIVTLEVTLENNTFDSKTGKRQNTSTVKLKPLLTLTK